MGILPSVNEHMSAQVSSLDELLGVAVIIIALDRGCVEIEVVKGDDEILRHLQHQGELQGARRQQGDV